MTKNFELDQTEIYCRQHNINMYYKVYCRQHNIIMQGRNAHHAQYACA